MSSKRRNCVLFVAPHPDDEAIGCGGTALRHLAHGDETHWLIVTSMDSSAEFSAERRAKRSDEIDAVATAFGFASVTRLPFAPAGLDTTPRAELVRAVSTVIQTVRPTTVYAPFAGDAHSDHEVTCAAISASTKWFRADFVEEILCYETLSETDAATNPTAPPFVPNRFVDVSPWLERKLEICRMYSSEFAEFPFPRSAVAIRALAAVRGAASGFAAAEAFMLLRSRVS